MSVSTTPTNRNFLSPLNFKMVLQRAPNLNFFLQGAEIPGLAFHGGIIMNTPLINIPIPGERIMYNPLTVSFAVDEDLANYLEIFNWMLSLATVEELEPFAALQPNTPIPTDVTKATRSDIKLMILTSSKNPNIEITFESAFPSHLGALNFNSTGGDVNYLETTVTFDYVKYTINQI